MKIRLFRTSDNYHHHYRHWTASGDVPRGYVVALHGIQSHSGWYDYSSSRMSDEGFDVRFLDRRGSGLNGCQRGHTPHYERLVHDVKQFLTALKAERDAERPGAPILLIGLSWGAKVAALTAARSPDLVDGLGLLYPGICARIKPSLLQKRLLNLGLALGKGEKRVAVPLSDPALFTGEAHYQEFIRQDRLALHQVSLDFLHASQQLESELIRGASRIVAPLLLMLAGDDEIIDNRRTLGLLPKFSSPQETVIVYGNARHTLEFEQNRHQIMGNLIQWMTDLCRQWPVR